jgi:hypothetical protein
MATPPSSVAANLARRPRSRPFAAAGERIHPVPMLQAPGAPWLPVRHGHADGHAQELSLARIVPSLPLDRPRPRDRRCHTPPPCAPGLSCALEPNDGIGRHSLFLATRHDSTLRPPRRTKPHSISEVSRRPLTLLDVRRLGCSSMWFLADGGVDAKVVGRGGGPISTCSAPPWVSADRGRQTYSLVRSHAARKLRGERAGSGEASAQRLRGRRGGRAAGLGVAGH